MADSSELEVFLILKGKVFSGIFYDWWIDSNNVFHGFCDLPYRIGSFEIEMITPMIIHKAENIAESPTEFFRLGKPR